MNEQYSRGRHQFLQLFRRVAAARELVVFGITVGLFVIFGFLSGGIFSSADVIGIMAISASEIGLIAIGMTFLMIAGEFDLSVGAISALSAYVIAVMAAQMGVNPFLGMVIAIIVGMAAGGINGLVTVKFGIPSFIVTLGTNWMWRGVVTAASRGQWIEFRPSETHPAFYNFLLADLKVGSVPLLWFIFAIILATFILNFHRFGNHVFATGGNREAAKAMGIKTGKVKVLCFMFLGGISAFSGCMQVSRMAGFQSLQGSQIMLVAIAAVAIGGTSIYGGRGTIFGTLFGVLIVTFLQFGLIMTKVSGWWYKIILGALVVVVMVINNVLDQRRKL